MARDRGRTIRRARSLTARIAGASIIVLVAFLAVVTTTIDALERGGAPALAVVFTSIVILAIVLGAAVARTHARTLAALIVRGAPPEAYPRDAVAIVAAIEEVARPLASAGIPRDPVAAAPDARGPRTHSAPTPPQDTAFFTPAPAPDAVDDAALFWDPATADDEPTPWSTMLAGSEGAGPVTEPVPAITLDRDADDAGDHAASPRAPENGTPPAPTTDTGHKLDDIVAQLRRIAQGDD